MTCRPFDTRAPCLALAVGGGLAAVASHPRPPLAQTVLKFAWQLPVDQLRVEGGGAHGAMHPGEDLRCRIKVETFPAGQLYRARQLYEAARTGAIDLAMFALGSFATTDPMVDIVYLPFVVPSQQRMFEVASRRARQVRRRRRRQGQRPGDGIFRRLGRPIRQQGPGAAQAGGFQRTEDPRAGRGRRRKSSRPSAACPTTVDASEVYLALQRGTVDGTNFPLTSFYDRKLYETVEHLTMTNVSFDPDVVVIGAKPGRALPPRTAGDAVKACAADGEKWVRERGAAD